MKDKINTGNEVLSVLFVPRTEGKEEWGLKYLDSLPHFSGLASLVLHL